MPSIHKSYREGIKLRFLEAIRRILMSRVKGVRTVTQLAPMIGAMQQNISQMEHSDRYPTLDQIARLCEIFNYSPEWIILGKGNMENTSELNATVAVHEDRLNRIELALDKLLKSKK